MFRGAKVLVAGGAGFVGANLVERLLSLGADVRATIHKKSPIVKDSRIDYIKCDLTDMNDCQRVVNGVDYVFMCAASSGGAGVIRSSHLSLITPNVVMNTQMLEASYFAKVKKFVFISSNAVYPPSDEPMREGQMLDGDPHEAFFGAGWMKRYAEILCRFYSEKLNPPMPAVVLRPSNIYGPCDDFDPETSHVMAALIRKAAERQDPLEVWGTGEDIRDWIYIDDFIDAVLLATDKIDTYNPLNIAYGGGHTIKEALQTILEVVGYEDARVVFNSSKPSTVPIRLLDVSRAEEVLGFRAKTGLEEGIRKTIKWHREVHQ